MEMKTVCAGIPCLKGWFPVLQTHPHVNYSSSRAGRYTEFKNWTGSVFPCPRWSQWGYFVLWPISTLFIRCKTDKNNKIWMGHKYGQDDVQAAYFRSITTLVFLLEGRIVTTAMLQSLQCSVVSHFHSQAAGSMPSGQSRGQVNSWLQSPHSPCHRAAALPRKHHLKCAWAKIRVQQSKPLKHMDGAQNHKTPTIPPVPRNHSKPMGKTLHLKDILFELRKRK